MDEVLEILNKFKKETPLQIRFNDIDLLGHVNNAMYQHFFDLGRLEYFDIAFKEAMSWDSVSLVLVHIEIDFMNSIRLEDKAKVLTRVCNIGNKSISMEQIVLKYFDSRPEVCAISRSVLSGFSPVERKSVEIPEKWVRAIVNFEGNNDIITPRKQKHD